MPVKKPTKSSLEARKNARKALMEALRAIREARKSVAKAGSFRPVTVDPIKYPPQPPNTVCRLSTSPAKVNPVFPPNVPTFICKILRFPPHVPAVICHIPPVPKGVTEKDLALGLFVIEFWTRFLVKVFDKLYPKQPTLPRPKSRA
jgi:hypothetical protein